jgi:hypothetical protein
VTEALFAHDARSDGDLVPLAFVRFKLFLARRAHADRYRRQVADFAAARPGRGTRRTTGLLGQTFAVLG